MDEDLDSLDCDASSSSIDSSRSGRRESFEVAICCSRLASNRKRVVVGYVAKSRCGVEGRDESARAVSGEAGRRKSEGG